MAFLVGGANSAVSVYDIENSMRFNRDDSPRLTDTTNATGDKQKFTVSAWVKHHYKGSGGQYIWNMYHGSPSDANWIAFGFNADSKFACQSWNSDLSLLSTAQHRDPSAWYHVVLAVDTTQSTEALRARVYINGSEITAWGTENRPDQNHEYNAIGTSGATIANGCAFNDGSPPLAYGFQEFYLADFYFIDGTQYAPGDFGETDEDSGIWKPKNAKDDLTFGSNGIFLEFQTSGTLGEDTSGNSDDLTSTNLAATDQCTDTPTNNFCTWNPLDGTDLSDLTFTEGNTKVVNATGVCRGTLAAASGKWYWEVKQLTTINGSNPIQYGVADTEDSPPTHSSLNNALIAYSDNDAQKSIKKFAAGTESTVSMTEFTSISVNDIIMFAFDADTAKLWVGINGTWLHSGDPATGSNEVASTNSGNFFTPCLEHAGVTYTIESNFGNPPYSISSSQADDAGYGNFEYDVPAGFYALCTKNLAEYG